MKLAGDYIRRKEWRYKYAGESVRVTLNANGEYCYNWRGSGYLYSDRAKCHADIEQYRQDDKSANPWPICTACDDPIVPAECAYIGDEPRHPGGCHNEPALNQRLIKWKV